MKRDKIFIGMMLVSYCCLIYDFYFDTYVYDELPLIKKVYDTDGIRMVKESWFITFANFTYPISLLMFFTSPFIGAALVISKFSWRRLALVLIALSIFYVLVRCLNDGGFN